jgi:dimeric dUTPase (all-alpha-NTP-PPase superfamily)
LSQEGDRVMNLQKLFEAQRKLDEHIIREKGLEGQDLLPGKILALYSELGELLNEWRGFKFWSEDREPRVQRMLEEYVDCLHFTLSIGLDLYAEDFYEIEIQNMIPEKSANITVQFIVTLDKARMYYPHPTAGDWYEFTRLFLGLGEMLGFTWDEIEEAYFAKNRINHERQECGY